LCLNVAELKLLCVCVIQTPTEKAPTYKYKMKYDMAKRLWQAAVEHHAFFR